MSTILYETTEGYITLEPTGKSKSYVVWIHGVVAATRKHTIGTGVTNAFERAVAALAGARGSKP